MHGMSTKQKWKDKRKKRKKNNENSLLNINLYNIINNLLYI